MPSIDHFRDVVTYLSQVWGGANRPIVPSSEDGTIHPAYESFLTGSAVDGVVGLPGQPLLQTPLPKVNFITERTGWRDQFAIGLFRYRKQKKYAPLILPGLVEGDPWRDVYAANLGLLPSEPNAQLLKSCDLIPGLNFGDFLRIERPDISGSLSDLVERVSSNRAYSARTSSMVQLAAGGGWSNGIRSDFHALPMPDFARLDAGPNVVVVCSPGNVEDLALLWNLRAAAGDSYLLPIGIPADCTSRGEIEGLAGHRAISRHGFASTTIRVTSTSLNVTELRDLIGPETQGLVGYSDYRELLHFGFPAGWTRDEILVWHEGRTSFVPIPPGSHKDILGSQAFGRTVGLEVDVAVPSSPFPRGHDIRIDTFGEKFFAGSATRSIGSTSTADAVELRWPSSWLRARSVAGRRGLELQESEPGRAAKVSIDKFDDLLALDNLAHEPLLQLLEEMAAHSGVSYYKRALQKRGEEVDPSRVVAQTSDDLPEKSMHDFKRVLGNNQAAAKFWLIWAETAGLVIKGFPLRCPRCGAKQWTPVAAFAPPLVCRGCGDTMDTPFGDRSSIEFMYRLSERLRRVYEHDAMGHLLLVRYFRWLLGSPMNGDLIGMHPGTEVRKHGSDQAEGEADMLMLTSSGDLIPMEVKRSYGGMTRHEVDRLDHLAKLLHSPWSAVAVSAYGQTAPDEFVALEHRTIDSEPFRVILAYDRLLAPSPIWALGDDPFGWSPLTSDEIEQREHDFVKSLVEQSERYGKDWFAERFLRARDEI